MARILFKNLSSRWRFLHQAGGWLEAAGLRVLWALMRRMSPARASAIGDSIFRRLGPLTHKHGKICENLRHVLGAVDERTLNSVAGEVWGNLGAVMAEMPNMARFSTDSTAVSVDIDPTVQPHVDAGKPCVYVFPHLANWELPTYVLCARGVKVSVIYSPHSNPEVDQLIQSERVPEGSRCIPKQNGIRQLIREIRSGRSVALLPDQRVEEGESVTFFNSPALTTTSPAWLAAKFDCPLVPVRVIRTGSARFRVVFHAPVPSASTDRDDVAKTTRKLNQLFEQWIAEYPGQWLCAKRRWPRRTSS